MIDRSSGGDGSGHPIFTGDDVAVLRAAASLAASVEAWRRASHLEVRLRVLADRVEQALLPMNVAA